MALSSVPEVSAQTTSAVPLDQLARVVFQVPLPPLAGRELLAFCAGSHVRLVVCACPLNVRKLTAVAEARTAAERRVRRAFREKLFKVPERKPLLDSFMITLQLR